MEKKEKIFIKDESLNGVDEDFFRHRDLAKNVRCMIDSTEPPFNIAVIGKWGLGKSSLINMVIGPMKNDEEHYMVQEINAWKYSKDELCRTFLKKIYQKVSGEKSPHFESVKQDFSKIISENQEKQDISIENGKKNKIKKAWKNIGVFGRKYKSFFITALITLILTILLFVGYSLVSMFHNTDGLKWSEIEWGNFLIDVFLSYCRNIGSVFIIPLLIWMGKIYMDAFVQKQHKTFEMKFPLETKDDYEIYLEKKFEEIIKEKPNLKIVTVIDDLDRLSIDKIIEALDALKAFMDYKRCVFIVPFDDEILKNAINLKKLKELNKNSNDVIESQLVLDKLFQYKVYLPELIKIDIKDYAAKLCKKDCADFINIYSNEKQVDRIIRNIIIHSDVKTPRQVKKLINAFVNNVIIAYQREKAGKVQVGFSTSSEGMNMIAKLSVLQADFNDFYDLLFVDVNVMDKILEIHRYGEKEPDEVLSRYFNRKGNGFAIKKEYMPLINFLSATERYRVSSVISYLYMAQDEISVLTGDKTQQEFLAAVISRNFKTAQNMISEIPELALALKNTIEYSDDIEEVAAECIMAINLIDVVKQEYISDLSNVVALRMEEVANLAEDIQPESVNYRNLYILRGHSDYQKAFNDIIERYIDVVPHENSISLYNSTLKNINVLNEPQKDLFKSQVQEYLKNGKVSLEDIQKICNDVEETVVREYLGVASLRAVEKSILDNTDFEEKSLQYLEYQFNMFINETNINEEINLVFEIIKYPALHELLCSLMNDKLLENISFENATQMIEILIDIQSENYTDSSYELLQIIPYKVNKNNSERFDEFFTSILPQTEFAKVVEAYAKNNELLLLSNTITNLIDNVYSDMVYFDDFLDLYKFMSKEQLDIYYSKLKGKLTYVANKDYKNEVEMVEKLNEIGIEDYAEDICNIIMQNLASRYNYINYVKMSVEMFNILIVYTSNAVKNSFVDKCILAYEHFPVEITSAFLNINEFIDKSIKTKMLDKVMTLKNEQAIENVVSLIINNSVIFSEENNNISRPIEFFIKNYSIIDNKKAIIDFVNKFYKNIPKEFFVKLSNEIIDEQVNISYASGKLEKFIRKYSIEVLLDIYINLLSSNESCREKVTHLIFSDIKLLCEVLDYFEDNIETYNHSTVSNIIEATSGSVNNIDVKRNIVLLSAYLKKNQDVDENEKALKRIEMLLDKKSQYRDKINELLYLVFSNTTSNGLKESVVKIVRKNRLTSKFKKLLNEEQMKAFEVMIK